MILNENFDNGFNDPDNWSLVSTHGEHRGSCVQIGSDGFGNGYLETRMDRTDNGGEARYTFAEPVQNVEITYDRFHHANKEYYLPNDEFYLKDADGKNQIINIRLQDSFYIGDNLGDNSNIDQSKLSIKSGEAWQHVFGGMEFSSYFDRWTTVTVKIDTVNGSVSVDLDSDGNDEFYVQDAALIGSESLTRNSVRHNSTLRVFEL